MIAPIGNRAAAPVNVVLIGPPGCGKGTQAVRLAERYQVPHISTGEILRSAVRAGTELGRQVADTLTKGSLVSDELMDDLVRARLAEPDTSARLRARWVPSHGGAGTVARRPARPGRDARHPDPC